MKKPSSYGQILRSTTIMGGVAGVTTLLGMIRTKLSAVLIGLDGVGLLSGYNSIQTLMGTISGFGIQSSAVRELALLTNDPENKKLAVSALHLQRVGIITGIVGLLLTVALSPVISKVTFGNSEHLLQVALLGLSVLLSTVAGSLTALMQGLRMIGNIARVNLAVAIVSTVISLVCYLAWGIKGIMPSLILISVFQVVIAILFTRNINLPKEKVPWRDTFKGSVSMLKLGFVFMWNSLVASAVNYFSISLITQQSGMQSVGIYSASFTLSGIFVNFILASMGTDYYPRLASISNDGKSMNQMVNEQTEICLLLSLPGLVATLSFAPWVIHIFYTKEFLPAILLLYWFILGCFGRIVSWPLGFLLLALGKKRLLLINETAFNVFHLLLIYLGLKFFGLVGVAIAFFVLYVLYTVAVYVISVKVTGFHWTREVISMLVQCVVILLLTLAAIYFLPSPYVQLVGGILTLLCSYICLKWMFQRIGETHTLYRIVRSFPWIAKIFR